MTESFVPGLSRSEFLGLAAGASLTASPASTKSLWDDFQSSSTPASFARLASRGQWQPARHLLLLNRYLYSLARRQIKRLIVTLPPRHGKSSSISRHFASWYLGSFPDHRIILMSHANDLADYWSGKARDNLLEFGRQAFRVHVNQRSKAVNFWNLEGHDGGMKSTGILSGYVGFGANVLIIDDVLRNAEQAESKTIRDKIWDEFISTAYSRLEPDGIIVVILTRWHQDDLVGRLVADMEQGGERWTVLNLPAIAEYDEEPWPVGLGRHKGEALWPERFPLTELAKIRQRLTDRFWSALYQQRPSPAGGGMFRREWLPIQLNYPPFVRKVRYWDMASTEARGGSDPDWTAGVLMARGVDGLFYVLHVARARNSPGEIERLVLATAIEDSRDTHVWMEQEPGASGKIAVHNYAVKFMSLEGGPWIFHGEKTTGPKQLRADPLSSAAQHGFVRLVRSWRPWDQSAFLDEAESFPYGTHDDQIDAAAGAYSKLNLKVAGRPALAGGRSPAITQYVTR